MGDGDDETGKRPIDLYAVSAVRALKRAGWDDEAIAQAYETIPPLNMSTQQIVEHNKRFAALDDEISHRDMIPFQGDP